VKLLDEAQDIVAGKIVRGDGKIESQALVHWRDGDGTSDREAVMAVPTIMDRGLALGAQVRRTVGWSMNPV